MMPLLEKARVGGGVSCLGGNNCLKSKFFLRRDLYTSTFLTKECYQSIVRRKLKKLTHSGIAQEILSQIWKHSIWGGEPVVVLDAPLLFESKASLLCKVGDPEPSIRMYAHVGDLLRRRFASHGTRNSRLGV
jgi:hypothetical protein